MVILVSCDEQVDVRHSRSKDARERCVINARNVGLEFFVSPHAVAQFQSRIAPLEGAIARKVIEDGIRQATNVNVLPDGATLRVRTKRPFPFEFRAYLVFDKQRGHSVVTTIVRGDSNVTRKHRRSREPESEML